MDDLLNSAGTCAACGAKVENIERMKGCSRDKLAERHAETGPGLLRTRKTKETT